MCVYVCVCGGGGGSRLHFLPPNSAQPTSMPCLSRAILSYTTMQQRTASSSRQRQGAHTTTAMLEHRRPAQTQLWKIALQ